MIVKKGYVLKYGDCVLLSEDRSYAIFMTLEDAEKEKKEIGTYVFFSIEEVNIEFKEWRKHNEAK